MTMETGKMRLAGFTIITFALFIGIGQAAEDDRQQFLAGTKVGTLQSPLISEASGITASRKNANVLWTHNDSGDSPRIYAMSNNGTHLGIYNLTGALAKDYEDIAIGPGPVKGQDYLYIGDIGDNGSKKEYITVYRVAEPVVDCNQTPVELTLTDVESISLKYPDGPRDAETLMVDPVTKDIYIISKRTLNSRVYRTPYPQSTTSITTMEYKCQLPWGWAVGGDISPKGNSIIVRNPAGASLWKVKSRPQLWQAFLGTEYSIPLVPEPQGEAICFAGDGRGYFTVSEKKHQPLYYFAEKNPTKKTADKEL